MDETVYRLSFEVVKMRELYRFNNADPMFYKNTKQTVPNSQIPDEFWEPVSRQTTDPWSQYNKLKEWVKLDVEFVRNVKLEKMVSEPRWEPVE